MSLPRLAAEVAQRAAGRCEYCCMHQSLQGATFHVEHIVPAARAGTNELVKPGVGLPELQPAQIRSYRSH